MIKVIKPAQNHTASKWQRWDLKQGFPYSRDWTLIHIWKAQLPQRTRPSLRNCIYFPEATMGRFSATGWPLSVLLLRKLMHEKVKSEEVIRPMLLSSIQLSERKILCKAKPILNSFGSNIWLRWQGWNEWSNSPGHDCTKEQKSSPPLHSKENIDFLHYLQLLQPWLMRAAWS